MSIMNTVTKYMCSFKTTPYLVILLLISIIMVICVHSYVPLNNNHTVAETPVLCEELAYEREIAIKSAKRTEEYSAILSCIYEKKCLSEFSGYYSCLKNLECAECINRCIMDNKNILSIDEIISKLRCSL